MANGHSPQRGYVLTLSPSCSLHLAGPCASHFLALSSHSPSDAGLAPKLPFLARKLCHGPGPFPILVQANPRWRRASLGSSRPDLVEGRIQMVGTRAEHTGPRSPGGRGTLAAFTGTRQRIGTSPMLGAPLVCCRGESPRTFLADTSHFLPRGHLAISSHQKWPASHENPVKVRALSASLYGQDPGEAPVPEAQE
jgi:hypothetical protein